MDANQTEAGTTEECLARFARKYDFLAAKRLLAGFAAVNNETASRWLHGKRMPNGLALVRLRVFLTLAGYSVQEFLDLPEDNRKLAEIIAFGLLDPKQVQGELGYVDDQGVLDMALRGRKIMPGNSFRLEQLLAAHREQQFARRQEYLDQFKQVLKDGLVIGPPAPRADPDHRSANGRSEMSAGEIAELVQKMDERNTELEEQLKQEREARAAAEAEAAELRERLQHQVPISPAIREKYLGGS